MLYNFLVPLSDQWSFLNLFKYITVRTIGATLTALILSFIIGPIIIKALQRLQTSGQPIRSDGPKRHIIEKAGTPTMGGTMILLAITIPTLLWADITNPFIQVVIGTTLAFGAIGFWDDFQKIVKNNTKGVPGRLRFFLQTIIALALAYALREINGDVFGQLSLPFLKDFSWNMGMLYFPFAIIVIVGSGNAVNLTDGLDGLAIAPAMLAGASFLIISYVTGNINFAGYLGIPYIAGAGELAVFCGAMVGAALGFLWFNTYPAQV
ncbi:MAG: phospho-N-acetylmuramoyl-pentapeptide-transferase, partial [Magnetococcales bacterium]|nr:phospho-N-acetylmuramoyl-pentapeptide-transferase [Magnetococcales bacterium]